MGMALTIVLIAMGAILTFGVDWELSAVNLDVIGVILMAVGLLGLASYVSIFRRRRVQPPSPAAPVIEENHRHQWRP